MPKELQSIFNTLSTGVVVLNNKAEVKFLNQYMTNIVKKIPKKSTTRRAFWEFICMYLYRG